MSAVSSCLRFNNKLMIASIYIDVKMKKRDEKSLSEFLLGKNILKMPMALSFESLYEWCKNMWKTDRNEDVVFMKQ